MATAEQLEERFPQIAWRRSGVGGHDAQRRWTTQHRLTIDADLTLCGRRVNWALVGPGDSRRCKRCERAAERLTGPPRLTFTKVVMRRREVYYEVRLGDQFVGFVRSVPHLRRTATIGWLATMPNGTRLARAGTLPAFTARTRDEAAGALVLMWRGRVLSEVEQLIGARL